MGGEGDYAVVIEFDPWATDQLRGRQWHPSQQTTELPGGASRFHLRLSALEEVERQVLSWGTHATVIRPQLLANRLHQTTTTLTARYTPQN